jgi:uncharacterized membrane protein YtjA (UPF0391 family)
LPKRAAGALSLFADRNTCRQGTGSAKHSVLHALTPASDGSAEGRPIELPHRLDTAHPHRTKENDMLKWAIIFAAIALVAGVFGFTGIAAGAAGIAKFLFVLFLVLFVAVVLIGLLGAKAISNK